MSNEAIALQKSGYDNKEAVKKKQKVEQDDDQDCGIEIEGAAGGSMKLLFGVNKPVQKTMFKDHFPKGPSDQTK